MSKMLRVPVVISFFIFGLFSLGFTEETLTITTYYPSPYGIYRELRSQRMAVGDTYINRSTACWDPPCGGGTDISDATTGGNIDLIVEGSVGIGTVTPSHKLQISDIDTAASRAGLSVVQSGAITGTGYGGYFTKTGASTTNVGLYASATDATNNYGLIVENGNVGIGTTNPSFGLDLVPGFSGDGVRLQTPGANSAVFRIDNPAGTVSSLFGVALSPNMLLAGTVANDLVIRSDNGNFLFGSAIIGEFMRITNTGNVGIGTTNPQGYQLYVNGNQYINGTLTIPVPGAIGGDIAEYIEALDSEAADVVIIDTGNNQGVQRSTRAYDYRVAGVISGRPAFLIGNKSENSKPLALAGQVKCKVTTEGGAIKRGDLLVTSSKAGYAMRGDVDKIKPGMLIGKALEPLEKGEGKIAVLITGS